MTTAPASKLVDLTLASFAEQLSYRSPTPGGGSAAALLAGMGAGLVAMACRFSTGAKYQSVEADMAGRAKELDGLRCRALELVDEDTAAYDKVTSAYQLPKVTEAEKAARTAAVQAALHGALALPLETMSAALAVLRLAAAGASGANPNLKSDLETGALVAWSGLEGARANVEVNAASIADRGWADARLREAHAMVAEAQALLDRVRGPAPGARA